ncbi:MAG: FUSC family protein [Pseudobdellovibrio sp.]
MGGVGAELERGFLFFILQFLSGVYSSSHMNQYTLQVLGYSFLAYASIVVVLVLSVVLKWHLPKPFVGIRSVLKNTIIHRKNYYIYAVYYALTALLALLFTNALKIDHGYWVVSTVLLVMRPDIKLSVYRNIQRFFVTLTGFFVAEIFISQIHIPEVLIGVLALFSFLGPWALSKNYGLGTFVVVIMILLIIDLPLVQIGDLHTPLIRLHSTMLGCGLA